jgi:hypothetical protein
MSNGNSMQACKSVCRAEALAISDMAPARWGTPMRARGGTGPTADAIRAATLIAAPVQCDVDGIPKGSHYLFLKRPVSHGDAYSRITPARDALDRTRRLSRLDIPFWQRDEDRSSRPVRPVPRRSAWPRSAACAPRRSAAPWVAAGHLLAPGGWRRLGRTRSSPPD